MCVGRGSARARDAGFMRDARGRMMLWDADQFERGSWCLAATDCCLVECVLYVLTQDVDMCDGAQFFAAHVRAQ